MKKLKDEEPVKTYQIILVDKAKREIVAKICDFTTNDLKHLKQKLVKLQEGYCEDEKPECFRTILKDQQGSFLAMCAESDSDFIHVVPIQKVHEVTQSKN